MDGICLPKEDAETPKSFHRLVYWGLSYLSCRHPNMMQCHAIAAEHWHIWAHFLFSRALAHLAVINTKNIQEQSGSNFPSSCRLQVWPWQPFAPSGELLRGSLLLWEMLSRPFSHTEAWDGAWNVRCEMWRDVKRLRCSKFGVKPLLLYSFRVVVLLVGSPWMPI